MKLTTACLIWACTLPALAGLTHLKMIPWDKREVSVCFHPRTLSQAHRQRIQQWVEAEFTISRVGIQFTGFQECQPDGGDVIAIGFRQGFGNKPSNATVGRNTPEERLERQPRVLSTYSHVEGWVQLSTSDINRETVVHEFGHVAGLEHEHLRAGAELDPRCERVSPSTGILRNPVYHSYYAHHGEYDPNSIMNYCYIVNANVTALSPGDIATLRNIYP